MRLQQVLCFLNDRELSGMGMYLSACAFRMLIE